MLETVNLSSYHINRKTLQSNYVSNYIREGTILRRKCSKWEYYTNLLCLAEGSKHLYQHAQQNSTDELAEKLLYCSFRDKQNFTLFHIIILSIFIPLELYFFILQQHNCALTCSHLYRMILVNKSIQLKKKQSWVNYPCQTFIKSFWKVTYKIVKYLKRNYFRTYLFRNHALLTVSFNLKGVLIQVLC